MNLVTYADGTPLIRAGKAYLTMTGAGLGFLQTAHWGVWELDLADPTELRQVSHLFFKRDGVVLDDHAGHVVLDDAAGEFAPPAAGAISPATACGATSRALETTCSPGRTCRNPSR